MSESSQTSPSKRPAEETHESAKVKQVKYSELKEELSSAFGTRKAQKAQEARKGNIIDTSGIGHVMNCLVETINESARSVPTREFVQAKQDELRPVPPYKLDAERPEDVYPLDGIILPTDVTAMKSQISALKKSSEETSRKTFLACRNSSYLNARLTRVFDNALDGKVDSKRLRIIYFASLLVALYLNRRMIGDREKLTVKMGNPPATLLDSLLSRFSAQNRIDDRNADRLLTHLFVLGLYLDNFASELRMLQEDLQLRPPQIATLYKELGCAVAPITEAQRVAAGLTKSEARSLKRAVLKVPLTFPPPKRGPAKR